MKKNIILIMFGLYSLVSFSQVKHATYSDSIVLNTTNYTDYFKVAASSNYDGYFLATKYDDLSYQTKHYINKVNFDGTVLWDTVYYFQEPYSTFNTGSIKSAISNNNDLTVTSEVSGTSSMGRMQPFIYNIDNNGTINWNKYFDIDSLDFYNSTVIKSADGGYLLFGGVSDYSSQPFLSYEYGYAYKLNAGGSLQWSKFYADKDTTQFSFQAGAAAGNGFVLAGNAQNRKMGGGRLATPNSYDNFLNVVNIDENGVMLWNSALYFDIPVDNVNYFQVKSVETIDALTVMVSFEYFNTVTSYYEMGLASLSLADGFVNWVKGYSLANDVSSFSPKKLIKKVDGNIVVVYTDDITYNGNLMELDNSGNVIRNKTIHDLSGYNPYYQDAVATEDGGVFIAASLNTGAGVLGFKTDKNLSTNCAEEILVNSPTVSTLSFDVYSIIDTVVNVTPFEGSLIPTAEVEISSVNDEYCSCELTIDGTLYYSGVSADSVLVTLYVMDAITGKYNVHDTITTNGLGYYHFNYLPVGDYMVKAEPSVIKYPNYMPTYFGMPNPTLQWDSSFVIHQECGINSVQYNIDLIQKMPQTGTWTCNGYVLEYYGFGTAKAAGEPLGDIDITLNQSPGGAVSSVKTDLNGFFEFTGLNNNATFVLRVDMPGYPNDSIYTFNVNPGDPAMDSLNFYVSADSVYILPEYIFTGVNILTTKALDVSISPNPTKNNFVLEVNSEKNSSANFMLCNSVGQEVYATEEKLTKGNNRINFEIKDYPQGIYYLRIINENDYFVKKIIKQ